MSRVLLAVALGLALAYIVRLRRELALAHDRGDMYRDIAATLDRHRTLLSTDPTT